MPIKISNVLKVGDYTLQYGQYQGIEEEYNADTQTLEKKRNNIKFIKGIITHHVIITSDIII